MLWGRRKATQAFLLGVNPTARAARELKLNKPECSVGTDESNDLIIPDSSVSRRHALIRRHRNKWQVLDGQSTNGTYIGDRKANPVDHDPRRSGSALWRGALYLSHGSGIKPTPHRCQLDRPASGFPTAAAYRPGSHWTTRWLCSHSVFHLPVPSTSGGVASQFGSQALNVART